MFRSKDKTGGPLRRKLVAGNWKMNGSLALLRELIPVADAARRAPQVDVAVCPPFTLIAPAVTRVAGALKIGGQDCHANPNGAHTGCIGCSMLHEAGARVVIIGHSERRDAQRESDAEVRAKAGAALGAELDTIVCVGESEADRAAGRHLEVVTAQLRASLPQPEGPAELVVAYEPIWAIGTGRTATPDDVAEMHGALRRTLVDMLGDFAGSRVRILYGGSVKADNAAQLFAVPDVDGALVGGASLSAEGFVPIIEAAAGTATAG